MPETTPHHQDVLLIRDLRFAGHDLRLDGPQPTDEPMAEQLALPGIAPTLARKPRGRPRPTSDRASTPPADDPLFSAYLKRLAARGVARKGWKAYRYQIKSTLLTAAQLSGRTLTCADLFQDENLLGRALVDDTAPTLGS